jgi:hypothetical protein
VLSYSRRRRGFVKREHRKNNFKGKRVGTIKVRGMIFIVFVVEAMDMKQIHVESHGKISKTSKNKRSTNVKLLNMLILLFLTVIVP